MVLDKFSMSVKAPRLLSTNLGYRGFRLEIRCGADEIVPRYGCDTVNLPGLVTSRNRGEVPSAKLLGRWIKRRGPRLAPINDTSIRS